MDNEPIGLKPVERNEVNKEALRKQAATAMITLREQIPARNPFSREPDKFEERRKGMEDQIAAAKEAGLTDAQIREEVVSIKEDAALEAYIRMGKLHLDTGGFPLGKTTDEQYKLRNEYEKAIKQAEKWGVNMDEVRGKGKAEMDAYFELKRQEVIKTAQELRLKIAKLMEQKVLAGESTYIYDLKPEEQDLARRAQAAETKAKLSAWGATREQLNELVEQYRQEQRPAMMEEARKAIDQIRQLKEATGTQGDIFKLGDITTLQEAQINNLNSLIAHLQSSYNIRASELGVKDFRTLGIYREYKGAKNKDG